jgi:predicted esterase
MKEKAILATLLAFLCTGLPAALHALTPGAFNAFQYDDGAGNTLYYQLWVPAGYDPQDDTVTYPLLVALHGAGNRRNDNPMPTGDPVQTSVNAYPTRAFVTAEAQAIQPHFILHPWCPQNKQWVDQNFGSGNYNLNSMPISDPMRAVLGIIDGLLAGDLPIDPDRVAITGFSMGGYGSFDAAARRPGLFSAVAPVAGSGPEPQAAAGIYGSTPIWAFHGDLDNIVPFQGSRGMVKAILDAGGNIRYREYPGFGHNTDVPSFTNPELQTWLLTRIRGTVNSIPPVDLQVAESSVEIVLPQQIHTPSVTITHPGSQPVFQFFSFVSGPAPTLFTPQNGGGNPGHFPKHRHLRGAGFRGQWRGHGLPSHHGSGPQRG